MIEINFQSILAKITSETALEEIVRLILEEVIQLTDADFGLIVIYENIKSTPKTQMRQSIGDPKLNSFQMKLTVGDVGEIALYSNHSFDQSMQEELEKFCQFAEYTVATILEIDRLKTQIEYLKCFDDLITKLPNRRYFETKLSSAIESQLAEGVLAILFIDLDDFKRINLEFGHSKGDVYLHQIAQDLLIAAQEIDPNSFLARVGGDEFALLISGKNSPDEIQEFASQFISKATKAYKFENIPFLMTVSIGISLFPTNGSMSQELMLKAGHAMYEAKKRGKNTVVFYGK